MPRKRERTVEGSCWPCRRRRVKCDLQKPKCGWCVVSGALCSYGKLRVRWSSRPPKGLPVRSEVPGALLVLSQGLLNQTSLAIHERRALEYFQRALWPLFTTVRHPCPPPLSLALQSLPVLLAICELAQAHHALSNAWVEQESTAIFPPSKRLDCLASIRQQLRQDGNNPESLSRLLVAVLLIYFLDGYIDCSEQSASTGSHQAGVQAIVESLGGFHVLFDKCHEETSMLLSEFASSNLTRSLLDNRLPCFPPDIWKHIEGGTVWWEKPRYGETSLASVFLTMAEMAFYRHSLQLNHGELSMDQVRRFEAAVQPSFAPLSADHLGSSTAHLVSGTQIHKTMHSTAFTRAFQHSATIYVYRAICSLHPRHYLVQQHVHSCIECIRGINRSSKAHNCIIFPLYVVGAHAFTDEHQRFVLDEVDAVHQTLRFSSLLLIRAALEELWGSSAHEGDWSGMFTGLAKGVLVL
ncbi:fungal-specific transcription factor domain-containing protein [Aspergillus carlsbadensis]|nr:fungal-specific transcription factor domain-containing protein [Aspergillus carlsbadensis]